MPRRHHYRCEATSIQGFIKQFAVTYVGRCRCFFYVTGVVSQRLSPAEHDRRMIAKYGLNISRFTRSRRKRAGHAPVHYLRYGDFWVLLCGAGRHKFFELQAGYDRETGQRISQYSDIRQKPAKVWFDWRGERLAYSIAYANGKARVQIERSSYLQLKAYFLDRATKASVAELIDCFWQVPFEPYGRVIQQLFCIKRAVDRARKTAGLSSPLPNEAIPTRRRPVCVFESQSARSGSPHPNLHAQDVRLGRRTSGNTVTVNAYRKEINDGSLSINKSQEQ